MDSEPGEEFGGLDFDTGPAPASSSGDGKGEQAKPKRRAKAPPASPIKQMVGIFGGGALGLSIGYVILCYVGGPKANFLNLPLPGLAKREAAPPPSAKQTNPVDEALAAAAAKKKAEEERLAAEEAAMAAEEEPPAEPAPVEEEPPPEPVTSANYVGPKTYKAYSAAELRQVVDEFGAASGTTIDPAFYRKLSHLAEVYTSVELVPMGWSGRERRDVVENLLARVVAGDSAANELGKLSAAWIASPNRTGPGVVAAGMLEEVKTEGRITRSRLMLFGKPEELVLLSRTRPAWQPPTPVLIMGMLVDDPVQGVAGYTGPPGKVVWTSMFIKR